MLLQKSTVCSPCEMMSEPVRVDCVRYMAVNPAQHPRNARPFKSKQFVPHLISTPHYSLPHSIFFQAMPVESLELGSLTSAREDNTQDNDSDDQPTMPLGVELTGYRLFASGVILGLGIPKAVYSYKGQALISTTLDWMAGVFLAFM